MSQRAATAESEIKALIGICFSPITSLGKPSTLKSYECASARPAPLRLPACVAGRPQSVAIRCREASSFV